MADSFQIVTTREDVQAIGANEVIPVQRVTARTTPSGVVFDLLLPSAAYKNPDGSFDESRARLAVAAIAERIETYIGQGLAVGAEYVEDLNAAGALVFYIDFTVEAVSTSPTKPGPFTAVARVPIGALEDSNFANAIARPRLERAMGVAQGFRDL